VEWTTAKLKRSSFAHDAPILALVYSPTGATLFTGSEDRRIKAWDAATLQERHVYENLPDWPQTLAVNRDGTQLAAGFFNGDLVISTAGARKKVRDVLKAGKPQIAGSARFSPLRKGGQGGRAVWFDGLQIANWKLKNANWGSGDSLATESAVHSTPFPPPYEAGELSKCSRRR